MVYNDIQDSKDNIAFVTPRPISVLALHGGKKELIEVDGKVKTSKSFYHSTSMVKDPHLHTHTLIRRL